MDKDRLLELFDAIVKTKEDYKQARDELRAFEIQSQLPERPTQVENIDEWLKYVEAMQQYEKSKKEFAHNKWKAYRTYEGVREALLPILPSEVWFKHGEVGIGLSYQGEVKIRPWQDEMPSLDDARYD